MKVSLSENNFVIPLLENAKPPTILSQMIAEAREIREKMNYSVQHNDNRRNPMSLVCAVICTCNVSFFKNLRNN